MERINVILQSPSEPEIGRSIGPAIALTVVTSVSPVVEFSIWIETEPKLARNTTTIVENEFWNKHPIGTYVGAWKIVPPPEEPASSITISVSSPSANRQVGDIRRNKSKASTNLSLQYIFDYVQIYCFAIDYFGLKTNRFLTNSKDKKPPINT